MRRSSVRSREVPLLQTTKKGKKMAMYFAQYSIILAINLGVITYMVPTIIAFRRQLSDRNAIAILNLLLGWTGMFWVLVLIWALMEES